jgi:phenylalanyl-tRNA synthetase alpha chain
MQEIAHDLRVALAAASSLAELESIRVRFMGRNGIITSVMRNADFSGLSTEQRREFGQKINDLKSYAANQIDARKSELAQATSKPPPVLDITVPASASQLGHMHPISLIQLQLERIFSSMGFMVLSGFEVEKEHYNFDALNIPPDHPAREMHDTYWLTNGDVLRTHTSASQVRALEEYGVPLKAIFPGRCFRYETVDASHENTFYQLEGLVVDRAISVADLIGVMKALLREVFESAVEVRLRPGYFPFVEPGFELDFRCALCSGKGCSTCKNTGWVELIPCGLVHPHVLRNAGVNPMQYSGFAFGCGLTRLAMMKFRIPYIKLFNSGDIRFCEQFPALP